MMPESAHMKGRQGAQPKHAGKGGCLLEAHPSSPCRPWGLQPAICSLLGPEDIVCRVRTMAPLNTLPAKPGMLFINPQKYSMHHT